MGCVYVYVQTRGMFIHVQTCGCACVCSICLFKDVRSNLSICPHGMCVRCMSRACIYVQHICVAGCLHGTVCLHNIQVQFYVDFFVLLYVYVVRMHIYAHTHALFEV
jgi:hypothetical protein